MRQCLRRVLLAFLDGFMYECVCLFIAHWLTFELIPHKTIMSSISINMEDKKGVHNQDVGQFLKKVELLECLLLLWKDTLQSPVLLPTSHHYSPPLRQLQCCFKIYSNDSWIWNIDFIFFKFMWVAGFLDPGLHYIIPSFMRISVLFSLMTVLISV